MSITLKPPTRISDWKEMYLAELEIVNSLNFMSNICAIPLSGDNEYKFLDFIDRELERHDFKFITCWYFTCRSGDFIKTKYTSELGPW